MKIKNWFTFSFVAIYHLLLLCLFPLMLPALTWTSFILFMITYIVGGLSITVGYHRLYAHKSYSANSFFEWCILLGSTLSFEMSALMWSHDHRLHHNHVDTDKDPYSIDKGFWYAHILWLFDYKRNFNPALVQDLLKNPKVMFQDKYYIHLVIFVNVTLFIIGSFLVGPLASFYMGFLLRMAMIHHSTWFINSLCHTIGSRTYARELSAVDNAILALLTFGEGYHNYHHAFAADYRNGIKWYHFDPSKWTIWLSSKLGLVNKLRVINDVTVQKSLVMKDKNLILDHFKEHTTELTSQLKIKVETLSTKFETQSSELMIKVRELKQSSIHNKELLQEELKVLQTSLKETWKEWIVLTKYISKTYNLEH